MTTRVKKQHGGQRPGAGRPPKPDAERRVALDVRVPVGLRSRYVEWAQALGVTLTELVERTLTDAEVTARII